MATKEIFRSRISKPERKHCPTGEPLAPEYGIQLDENGHKEVYQKGTKNIYALIQENLESTLIENILKRAQLGDPTALKRGSEQYIDTTNLPTNLMEVQNSINKIKEQFMQLPIETRAKFGMNPETYVMQYGTKAWADSMGITEKEERIKAAEKLQKENLKKMESKESEVTE